MITLDKCAEILNVNGHHYSNDELKQIRELLYKFSRIDEILREEENAREDSRNLYPC